MSLCSVVLLALQASVSVAVNSNVFLHPHVIHEEKPTGIKPFLDGMYNTLKFLDAAHASLQDDPGTAEGAVDTEIQDEFERIYKENVWNNSESRSGSGSTMEATAGIRACLGKWLKKYKVKTFLDIPCGDANWQGAIPGIDGVSYFGYDIAPYAVEAAKSKNANSSNMKFAILDLVSNQPPMTAEMILVKEVIQHLPLDMGLKMLQNAKKAGIKWLAVTTNPKYENKEIKIGEWFPGPNAEAPPFNFQEPAETCGEHDLRLYDLESWFFR